MDEELESRKKKIREDFNKWYVQEIGGSLAEFEKDLLERGGTIDEIARELVLVDTQIETTSNYSQKLDYESAKKSLRKALDLRQNVLNRVKEFYSNPRVFMDVKIEGYGGRLVWRDYVMDFTKRLFNIPLSPLEAEEKR